MEHGISQLIDNGKFHFSRCRTQEELYEFLANDLVKEDLVKESFYNALLDREKMFPTGIVNQPYNIALPHVDAEHVKTNALIVCLMEEPIMFNRMDKIEEAVPVKMVFLLLIKSKGIHMKAIMGLTDIWSNPELMDSLLKVECKETMLQLLSRYNM